MTSVLCDRATGDSSMVSVKLSKSRVRPPQHSIGLIHLAANMIVNASRVGELRVDGVNTECDEAFSPVSSFFICTLEFWQALVFGQHEMAVEAVLNRFCIDF